MNIKQISLQYRFARRDIEKALVTWTQDEAYSVLYLKLERADAAFQHQRLSLRPLAN
jgi:hypothetical protein